MRSVLVGLVALSCVTLLISPAVYAQCGVIGGQCLINGTLDVGFPGGAGGPNDPGSAPPWTLINGGNPTAAQLQNGFADDTGVNGLWYRAFLGTPAAPVSSTFSQTAIVPVGGTYQLELDKVIEQNFAATSLIATLSSSGGPSTSIDLLNDRVTDVTYTGGGFALVPTTAPTYNIHSFLTLAGVNAGDTLTVSLAMLGGQSGTANPQSAVVDNFSLTRVAVPEPATIGLTVMGLLGLVGVARRRW